MNHVASEARAAADVRVPVAAVIDFTADAFSACGLPADDARAVAELMTEADLIGSDAHGVFRVPQYVGRLQARQINPTPNITIRRSAPGTGHVDGDNGMGHLVMAFAARKAVEIARETGVAWVGARRSNHAGAAGVYAAIPLAHDMIGIYAAAAGSNHMAPWGGAEPMLGTNPIAVAIPAGAEAPVVLDIATSVASFGKIRSHALAGEPMPEGWAIDPKSGAPITDARRVNEGLLLPIGGYKGSGLSLIVGLLAGPLNAATANCDVQPEAPGRESNTGQFIIALDVSRFMPIDAFKAEIDRQVRTMTASAPLPGTDGVRIPGQWRLRHKRDRQQNGVPLAKVLLRQLDELAKKLQLKPLTER
jgi:LDH2 family malate/lactate/ureidoglycolate dehydrogenase